MATAAPSAAIASAAPTEPWAAPPRALWPPAAVWSVRSWLGTAALAGALLGAFARLLETGGGAFDGGDLVWVQPALDQIVQQRLHHGRILRGSLDQAQRMLDPVAIDADGGQQRQVLGDMDAVNLDHQHIQRRQVGRHPFAHPLRRQRHEPTRRRRLRYAGAVRCWNIALWQPNGAPEPARRDIDQHQVHGPSPQPVLGLRRLPARQHQFVAVAAAHTGPFDRYLAAVETELACRLSPAMTAPAILSAVAPAAQLRRVTLHHIGQRRNPGGHAETLEARADIPPGRFYAWRDSRSACDTLLHGVALLRGFDTPSLHRLRTGNANLLISTMGGTSPVRVDRRV